MDNVDVNQVFMGTRSYEQQRRDGIVNVRYPSTQKSMTMCHSPINEIINFGKDPIDEHLSYLQQSVKTPQLVFFFLFVCFSFCVNAFLKNQIYFNQRSNNALNRRSSSRANHLFILLNFHDSKVIVVEQCFSTSSEILA